MRRSLGLALALFLGLVAGVVALGSEPVQAALACGPTAPPCLKVVFLGNSYTYENGMPAVFTALARSGGHGVTATMVANGGETLAQHAASSDSLGAIAANARGVVVIQEQSEIPADASAARTAMDPAARTIVAATRSAGSSPVLLETWAHLDGWPERGLDYARMQEAIDRTYVDVGSRIGVAVAPAGAAFLRARAAGMTDLWASDGSHPSRAGTFLAACALYVTVFGTTPVGLGYDAGLGTERAGALERLAAEAAGL